MIKQCTKCGSENLYLEPRIKGQDVMSADMVALKCKDCGVWLKWCPKDERKDYIHKYPKDKWQKLKEWVKNKSIEIKRVNAINEEMAKIKDYIDMTYRECYIKMQELEKGEQE